MSANLLQKIRILLIDDHSLFRESVARLLDAEQDFEMTGDCATVADGLALLRTKPVDIVLLDYDLGNERGSEFVRAAREQGFEGQILVVTAGVAEAEALQMLSQGVGGVFFKHSSPALLASSIRKLMAGEISLEERYLKSLLATASRQNDRRKKFTERDRQVLRGVFEGLANKEIADRLQISESSVKASLQQLFNKTGVRTRSQLVRIALEQYREQLF
ncbi:MAG: response regulator transcription factor [Bryobacterales bacterium]|nr:response regulator transcription factor [Bryobacterales bacterium]